MLCDEVSRIILSTILLTIVVALILLMVFGFRIETHSKLLVNDIINNGGTGDDYFLGGKRSCSYYKF